MCRWTHRLGAAVPLLAVLLMVPCAPFAHAANVAASDDWAADPPGLSALVAHARNASDMRTAVIRYFADRADLTSRYPVRYSPVRVARLRKFLEGWRNALARMDFDDLNREGQVDYILLRARIRQDFEQLRLSEEQASAIASLVPFGDDIRLLEEARLDGRRADPRTSSETVNAIAKQAEKLANELDAEAKKSSAESAQSGETGENAGDGEGSEKLEDSKNRAVAESGLSAADVQRAARHVGHLRHTLDNWYRAYQDYDPLFTWWVKKPQEAADKALASYANALDSLVAELLPEGVRSVSALPVLADGLRTALANEMIPYTPEEILAIGEREFDRTENRLKTVAREMGFGDDWMAALEHTKNLAQPPGAAPWMYYDIAEYAENFVERLGVVDLPPLSREAWQIALKPSFLQSVHPYASFGGGVASVAYAAGDMEHDDKLKSMRGNNQHFSLPVIPHELLPGHHLERFVASRFNTHRHDTPFFVEGWGFYWELFLWDAGFARVGPEKMGMLFWQHHRAARIIFSLNYELGNWSQQQCIDFLVNRVGHEQANAEAEVRRAVTSAPLYQVGYMVGALQLRALYRELVESGDMSAREFHNSVLIGGPMPIEMVRARLTDEKLTPDYESHWRFYDGLKSN